MRGREKTRSENYPLPKNKIHSYEVRPRKDHRGVDLISDALPFGRLWYVKIAVRPSADIGSNEQNQIKFIEEQVSKLICGGRSPEKDGFPSRSGFVNKKGLASHAGFD